MAYLPEPWEVRARAAEILAAVGLVGLRRIAVARAAKWADVASAKDDVDPHFARLAGVRAAEWWRIGTAATDSRRGGHRIG